ncbi:SDR family NAD(P)-dependent oxidoreductase [Sediminicola luteus]|uniref:Short-chain dehydrogenase n=1 Tax=Sediminicola luteus TaxID=319238 RepID=A0A2A4G2Q6_9FLAO|nr:SDR family oxidoreductase [Sediminicola luteus]PCE62967.1 short-chain dehydrogenase [Sediminicola luteus]
MKASDKKVAVITGGNSGIGYATAKLLKEEGTQVIISGRNAEKVEKAAQELGIVGITADVSKLSDIDALVRKVENTYSGIDLLFVNAGVFTPTPIGGLTEKLFQTHMDINFRGAVFTIEKFLPLLNTGASIINVSSISAYTGIPNLGIYAATKAALNSYTRTAAIELAPRNIRVNAISPGPISTPIYEKTGMSEEQIEGMAQNMGAQVPLKRFGSPEDVAHLVSFLASDKASFITGSEYIIDGGIHINTVLS